MLSLLAFHVQILVAPTSLLGQSSSEENDTLLLAQKLFEDSAYANAAQEFRRFIVNFPTSDRIPTAMFRLGESLFLGKSYEESRSAFRSFADRFPNHIDVARALRLAAESLDRLGDAAKAGDAFMEVHDAFLGGEFAAQDLLRAGYNFHRAGMTEPAENAFRGLIERYPQSSLRGEAAFNLGQLLRDAGRPQEARAQFEALITAQGDHERRPDAMLALAEIALSGDRDQEAGAIVQELRKTHRASAAAEESYLLLADWHATRGNHEQAIAHYGGALKALPANLRRQKAELGLAAAYASKGDHQRALDAYTRFLKGYPKSDLAPDGRLGLGNAYAGLGQNRSAVEAYRRLIEAFPESPAAASAYAKIGDIWNRLGDPLKALSAYDGFADRTHTPEARARAQLMRGGLFEQLEWFDLADRVYDSLLADGERGEAVDHPYAGVARYRQARTYEASGRQKLALREYRHYIRLHSGEEHAAEAERRIQYLQEFPPPETGASELIDVLASLPAIRKDPESHLHLARYLATHNRDEAAVESLASIIETDSVRAAEAGALLGDVYLRMARKSNLDGRPDIAEQHRAQAQMTFGRIVETHAASKWADDARLTILLNEWNSLNPDSLRARRVLADSDEFLKGYPETDRRDAVEIERANALLLLGRQDTALSRRALETFAAFSKDYPTSSLSMEAEFGRGLAQAQVGLFADAEESFREFLFRHPGSGLSDEARFQLGRILLDRGFHASAAEELAQLLEAPSSLKLEQDSRKLLAECYYQMGDFSEAIGLDTRSVERPDGGRRAEPAIYRRLARSYRGRNEDENAARIYADYLRVYPNASDADSIALERAQILANTGRIPEALSALRGFQAAYEASTRTPQALALLGDLHFQQDEYADALKAYARVPQGSRPGQVAGRIALSHYRMGSKKEAGEAVKAFRKAHGEDPTWRARFDVEQARLYLKVGNSDRARKLLTGVLEKYPDTDSVGDARYFLARSLEKQGKGQEHLEALIGFVNNHPRSPFWSQASLQLAQIYEGEEDYGQAARIYRKVLDNGLAPEERPDVYSRMIRDYRNLKLYDTAIAFATRLVEEHPRHPLSLAARMDSGDMLHEKGDHSRAIRELTPLLKSVQENEWSSVQHTIAESYFDMGDIESATREFLKLRYNFQGSVNWLASALIGLANCYEARGEIDRAVRELDEIRQRFGAASPFGTHAEEKIRALTKQM